MKRIDTDTTRQTMHKHGVCLLDGPLCKVVATSLCIQKWRGTRQQVLFIKGMKGCASYRLSIECFATMKEEEHEEDKKKRKKLGGRTSLVDNTQKSGANPPSGGHHAETRCKSPPSGGQHALGVFTHDLFLLFYLHWTFFSSPKNKTKEQIRMNNMVALSVFATPLL